MAEPIFEDITQRWFITEPALFAIYCTHHLEKNTRMKCAIRTGHGVIEYNPNKIPHSKDAREELLRSEVVRIMLKHPYARQPENVKKLATAIASDMVLSDNIHLTYRNLISPRKLGLDSGKFFEWYAHEVNNKIVTVNLSQMSTMSDDDLEALEEISDLWEEDEFMATEVNETIKSIKDWGSLPGKVVDRIKADLEAKIDYRKALAGFRASIVSSFRSLTRMKPNRRFSFDAMGSKYNQTSNILIAVDVSGSVTRQSLSKFFGVIVKFFKFGLTNLDVIQFDAKIQGEPLRMSKRFRHDEQIKVLGRGGTDFQPVFDYIKEHKQYDGLIVFTDGYAPEPRMDFPTQTKVLWACQSEEDYKTHHEWMEHTGRACFIETL